MKDNIKKIIIEWEDRGKINIIPRLSQLTYSEEINTVIGLRRCGKTYFIFSQIEALLEKGIGPTEFMYINLDEERLTELKGIGLDMIMEAYYELYPENRKKDIYLFWQN